MSFVAAAVGGGALIGAGVGIYSADKAAGAESNAANNALGLQQSEFNTEQANAAPYLQSGTNALNTLNADMPSLDSNFTMQDFQQSPGYQFQLNQGMQAMQRSAASKGLLNSVGTQQNLNNYAQGSANTDYQQALQNYMTQNQSKYNMLSGLANQGLQATGMANQAGQNYANNASNTIMGAGNVSAASSMAAGNSISSGISGATNGLMNYNLMSNMMNNQNPTGLTMPQIGSSISAAQMPNYGLGANTGTLGSLLPTD